MPPPTLNSEEPDWLRGGLKDWSVAVGLVRNECTHFCQGL